MSEREFVDSDMPTARRFIFAYEGDQVELVEQERVEMTAFPSEPIEEVPLLLRRCKPYRIPRKTD